ncbi:CarD family transcriptional regulator [Anaerolentibacter hominis]|uniref:CarD family transcriptional regulator n=1 Tax=Anaerolentibacter hominis TaxID=3079009 RepID=UPI0031B83F99
MYKINDVVVYENNGVYRIRDIGTPDFLNTTDQYYILQAVCNKEGTLYVKTGSNKLLMRAVIIRETAQQLLDKLPDLEPLYEENGRLRETQYHEIIKSCKCENCLRMLKGILREEKRRAALGKRLNISDERNLKTVLELLSAELSVALHEPIDEVKDRLKELAV